MILVFRIDEVFWNHEPKVNGHYRFDVNNIEFDITQYELSLYFPTADYYLLSDFNYEEIYQLHYVGNHMNPIRTLISKDNQIYNVIRDFYINEIQQRNN